MAAKPDITEIGRRGLNLRGWAERSIWGWDRQMDCLFAQLWRDNAGEDDGPEIWISPPGRVTTEPDVLAQWIAEATGKPLNSVLSAMGLSNGPNLLLSWVRRD